MKKKEIVLELVNDIPTLIRMQELMIEKIRDKCKDEDMMDFQEDILRVLKLVDQLYISSIDGN